MIARLVIVLCALMCWLPLTQAAQIIDSEKKAVDFSSPFQRIISLYPAHTINLIQMGAEKQIIACSPGDDLLPDRPRIQFQDDPERLLALKPDLVVIRPMISRGYPHLVSILEANNVRVVSLQPTEMEDLYAYWQNLGQLCGHEKEAAAMTESFKSGLNTLSEELKTISPEQRKHVYFESIHRQMKTFAPTSMAIFALETAGGINIAADAERMRETNIAAYGKERILAKAGQIDVYLAQSGRMNPVKKEEIVEESGFQVIKAIQEQQVFLVDEESVSRPTPDLLQGIRHIRELLYPQLSKKETGK